MLHIARTEVLEHWRQPSLLVVMVLSYLVVAVFSWVPLWALDIVASDPVALADFLRQLQALGVTGGENLLTNLTTTIIGGVYILAFTDMPVLVGSFAAYAVLHDRLHHTLPFMMLAPITRTQLLAGKVLGVMALPYVLHLVIVGVLTLLCRRLAIVEPNLDELGSSVGWWVAFLLGVPASAMLVGTIGAVVSALAPDVRSSFQWVGFLVFFLSLGTAAMMQQLHAAGPELQVVFTVGCLAGAFGILALGGRLISRDIGA